jgi:2-dehydropantoate 2-reductase
VVGAGAVGQVFALHLARGGAEVVFLVKPKYAEECGRGFKLYRLGGRVPTTESVTYRALTSTADAARERWDQVYLTVSSSALRGDWLGELARATGEATVVMLQPGLDDHAYVAEHVAEGRIVDGVINFLSYHAPLPGETRFAEPGMAYWLFPGRAPFSGEDARVRAVVAALRAGGLPAKRIRDVHTSNAFASAMLAMFVTGLEASEWSFRTMREGGNATLGGRAAAQAMRVVGHEVAHRRPLGLWFAARPFTFRLVLRLAPRIAPLDIEAYMKAHFTKVQQQMRDSLRTYLDRGRSAVVDVSAIEALTRQLEGRTRSAGA